jgi:CRP-like cAMP-binding protein
MTTGNNNDKLDNAESISELWDPLTDNQRAYLLENLSVRYYQKDEIIYQEGETPAYIMCLLQGKVKIYRDGVGGRNQIVRMIKERGFFAYRAGFAGGRYVTSASAFELSKICLIPLETIKDLIRQNNNLAIFFLKQLSEMLGDADIRTVSLTQKHIRGRLAESLIWLYKKYGFEEDGKTLNINISREDLANLSNMTTSNAIRTLSAFSSEKLIETDGRKIIILEPVKLKEISRMG